MNCNVREHPALVRAGGALGGRGDLGNIIGNPLETTVFLSRLIFDGTLDRFPSLKIPYNWPAPVDLILEASFLSNTEKEEILGGNLMKLLRIA